MWDVVTGIIDAIVIVLKYGMLVLGAFCVIDSASRRADAYAAADKQTKGRWVGLLVASGVVFAIAVALRTAGLDFLFNVPGGLAWLAAVIAVLVYLVDVRPNLKRVLRGGGW